MEEEWSIAHCLSRDETLRLIESYVLELLQALEDGENPTMTLVNRTESNTVRDNNGTIHLGKGKTAIKLFGNKGNGIKKFTRIWRVLAFIYELVQESKTITQREAYYSLTEYFTNQTEFNNTLQDVIALTGCTRASLGICVSSCGGIGGLVMLKEPNGTWESCASGTSGKRIPGQIDGIQFKLIGNPRYIIVVEKDAVFTYLCNEKIWEHIPCIVITGCGYPPMNVRTVLRQLKDQFNLPILGLFDYNPHGIRILLTYKHGSTRMGTESHAYAVDIKWIGIHHDDIYTDNGTPLVPTTSLQPWTITDHKVWNGLKSLLYNGDPHYVREIELMGTRKVKAEIEILNSIGFDGVQQRLIHKILCNMFY